MGSFIEKFLGFVRKPRDGVIAGIPLEQDDQIGLFVQTVQQVTVRVTALVYNPENGKSRTVEVLPPTATSSNNFTQEGGLSTRGLFSDGEVLTALTYTIPSGTIPTGPNCYCAAWHYRKGVVGPQLIGDFVNTSHTPSWTGGTTPVIRGPFFNGRAETPSLYTFQGTVVNGAGGAGTQSLIVTPPTGGRFEVAAGFLINGDTASRVCDIFTDDGTNVIDERVLANNQAAAGHVPVYSSVTAAATTTPAAGFRPITVAGGNRLVMQVAAVAASQDSTYALSLFVWGGSPTFTLAGASTPVLTTNTSRFETG